METHANDTDIAKAKYLHVLAESVRMAPAHAATTLIQNQKLLAKATMPVLLDTLDVLASLLANLDAKNLARDLDFQVSRIRDAQEIPRSPSFERIVDRSPYAYGSDSSLSISAGELFLHWTGRLGGLLDEVSSQKVS